MGRQQVMQITCDRCTRVEHQVDVAVTDPKNPAFAGLFQGNHVQFQDLCSGCEEILRKHWDAMTRNLTKMSPIHKEKSNGTDSSKDVFEE